MKNSKKYAALGMAAAMAFSMAACGGGGGSSSGASSTASSASSATADAASDTAAAEVDKSQSLVIYTNSGSNGRDAWLKERAAKDGYKVEVVSIQGADLANRLIAEKNNPQADMVFGLNALEYEKLKKESLLDKWAPAWTDDVDVTLGDGEYYYPIVIQPLVNIMSADLENPPTDYTDLVKPEWTDKYTILNFGGGTGKTLLSGLLVRYQDPDGEFGVSQEGWDFVKSWIQNGHMEQDGEDKVGNVINNTFPICEMWGSGVLQEQSERDYTFQIMSPEIGVPYVTEQVAMVTGSKKQALAIDFANWFGSAALQEEWMNQFGTIPCSKTAYANAPETVKAFVDKVHPQEMDWKFISQYVDQWVEKCELEFLQ